VNEDLAYLGGLIDGEGYIGINKAKKVASTWGWHFHPSVKVAAVDRRMPEFFLNRWGGRIDLRRFPAEKNQRDAWCWMVTTSKLVEPFIDDILPYLRLKKGQAEIVKEFCQRPYGKRGGTGRRSGADGPVAGTMSKEEFDLREALYWRIRDLNRVGRPPAQTE
jgi:hypothetical protein